MNTFKFNEFTILQKINEDVEEFISQVDAPEATQIEDLYNSQQEILQKYDLSSDELANINKGLEDTIRTKLGLSESFSFK